MTELSYKWSIILKLNDRSTIYIVHTDKGYDICKETKKIMIDNMLFFNMSRIFRSESIIIFFTITLALSTLAYGERPSWRGEGWRNSTTSSLLLSSGNIYIYLTFSILNNLSSKPKEVLFFLRELPAGPSRVNFDGIAILFFG